MVGHKLVICRETIWWFSAEMKDFNVYILICWIVKRWWVLSIPYVCKNTQELGNIHAAYRWGGRRGIESTLSSKIQNLVTCQIRVSHSGLTCQPPPCCSPPRFYLRNALWLLILILYPNVSVSDMNKTILRLNKWLGFIWSNGLSL